MNSNFDFDIKIDKSGELERRTIIMSNFDFDIKFDKPGELDRSDIMPGFADWGRLKLVAVKNVSLFAKGEVLTLKDVIINNEMFSRKGIKDGGPTQLLVFTLDGTNFKTGEMFTFHRLFDNKPRWNISDISKYPNIYLDEDQEKYFNKKGNVYISSWVNLQLPSLQKIGKKLDDLKKDGLWVRAENVVYNSYETNRIDDKGKPVIGYDKYWSEFTIFENEDTMKIARMKEDTENSDGIIYPKSWGDSVDAMLNYISTEITTDTNLSEKVVVWKFDSFSDVKAILKEAIDLKDVLPIQKEKLVKMVDDWEIVPF